MEGSSSSKGRYLLVAVLGAAIGGIAVAIATKAVPTMMSGMMETMMGRMGDDFDPEDM